ncbi:MAG: hypothetical protein QOI51_446 [Nocardioidaceae bacterium]|nr:hypothetical protein [Nocardioidaceae bacterium]
MPRSRWQLSRRGGGGDGALSHKLAIGAAALVLVAAIGVGVGVEAGWVPGVGQHSSTTSPGVGPPPPPVPGLRLAPPPRAPRVLAPTTGREKVRVDRLRRRLAGDLRLAGLGRNVGFAVSQLGNPAASWQTGVSDVTPASTMKLLTTSAALAALGPDHRFTTTVTQASIRGPIVLVGGGDPLLVARTPTARQQASLYPRPASLQELATSTAARLTGEGVRRVRLGYDASLFTGPAVNPRWPSTYIADNVVSPISALWVDEGRVKAGLEQRSTAPAAFAADVFRNLLERAGVKVSGPVRPEVSPRSTKELAVVSSAPLQEIVQHILELSDNEGAEVLLRQVAVASGLPGSSTAGVSALRHTLTGLGLDLRGATFYDGSGLSRQDVLPVRLLLHVLETAAAPSHPTLRGVVTGLPVAGFSGSLGYRFIHEDEVGRGYVRAKTGTLTGVSGLAGIALTRTGQALAFVAVADRVPETGTLTARADLEQIAATLSTCGC